MFGQQQQEQEALCEQYEERLTSYKLQVHQHSITICCLDKQASELRNSNMELQATVTSLTSNNAGEMSLFLYYENDRRLVLLAQY